MIKLLSYLFLLLTPILLILIVRLKRRQRIVYTHTFLKPFRDESLRDYLFRTFQLYYDVMFDLLLAVILAIFFSQVLTFAPRRTAVCIDGSYSMMHGQEGTPMERAVTSLVEGSLSVEEYGKYHLFLLAFDPQRGKSSLFRLRNWERIPSSGKEDSSSRADRFLSSLRQNYTFFNVDLKVLQQLYDRGYDRVVFLTDRFPHLQTNIEVIEVGESFHSFFIPVSVHYDFSSAVFQILLYRNNDALEISLLRFDKQTQIYREVPHQEQQIRGSSLAMIEIDEEGLFRIKRPGLDYTYRLKIPKLAARVTGVYSQIIRDVLPQLEDGGSKLLLADLSFADLKVKNLENKIRSFGKQPRKLITLIPEGSQPGRPLVHSLERSLSQPSYTEFPLQLLPLIRDETHFFFQDPKRIQDGQTALVYLSYLMDGQPFDFALTKLPEQAPSRWRFLEKHAGITSFVYMSQGDLLPLNIAPEEFFPVSYQQELVFSPREFGPLPYFLLLLVIYLAKIAFLLRIQGGH
jgi:hypothetical protein